jgi:D-galactarolactone cycloisomerase
MWDIRGKVTQQPVGTLLGGRYRKRVRPYASLLMEQPEPLADHLRAVRALGVSINLDAVEEHTGLRLEP